MWLLSSRRAPEIWWRTTACPVSLTCFCCKIMDHIITFQIGQHLDQHSILLTFQLSFRIFSCETQLLLTLQDLLSARDKNILIDLTVLDFFKAFDTVPHKRFGNLTTMASRAQFSVGSEPFLQIGPKV